MHWETGPWCSPLAIRVSQYLCLYVSFHSQGWRIVLILLRQIRTASAPGSVSPVSSRHWSVAHPMVVPGTVQTSAAAAPDVASAIAPTASAVSSLMWGLTPELSRLAKRVRLE